MSIDSGYSHSGEHPASSHRHQKADRDRQEGFDKKQLISFTEYADSQHRVQANQISPGLKARFFNNENLEESVLSAVRRLSKSFDQADVVAKLDTDPEEQEYVQVVVQVTVPYDSVKEYSEIKEQVRSIVRSAEVGDQMLYTRIHRME